jgi:hypothetical protein
MEVLFVPHYSATVTDVITNPGSALSANLRAANAVIITNLAASVGGATWMLWASPPSHFS